MMMMYQPNITKVFSARQCRQPRISLKWQPPQNAFKRRAAMRRGFSLPQSGTAAGAEAIVKVARRAEELGYDSLWVYERFLYPVHPQTPYPASPDGSYPEAFKTMLDPIETLTWAAAHTKKVTLGTSVLDMPFYNPVLLARRLTTLDVLSGGRVRVGLGLGWSKDEYDAVGRPMKGLAKLADEFIAVLQTIWTTDPAEFHGEFFTLPKSIIQPKPVQKPHPPIYLGAFTPGALRRTARVANGWNPVFLPVAAMKEITENIRSMARESGRDPAEIEVVVRANINEGETPLGEDRPIFHGSRSQIAADLAATRELGVDEIFIDPTFSSAGKSLDGFLRTMEQMRELL
jgi:probable F420-dependent oxidoreductase